MGDVICSPSVGRIQLVLVVQFRDRVHRRVLGVLSVFYTRPAPIVSGSINGTLVYYIQRKMSVTSTKEPQRKKSKRKSEDDLIQPETAKKQVPDRLWESKKDAIGPLFSHLFSWDTVLYRPVWKHEGPGIVFFFDCVFEVDMGPFKAKQKVASIVVNLAKGEMEIQEDEGKSGEVFLASLFWGVSKCQKTCQGNTHVGGSGGPDSTVL